MSKTFIAIIVFLIFLTGIVWLQIFLSKKKNKWLGLVIPIICFIFSIMTVMSMSILTRKSVRTETYNGVVIEKVEIKDDIAEQSIGKALVMTIPVFLVSNIPTSIFLAIYFACREKINRNSELEKMNIQDLE